MASSWKQCTLFVMIIWFQFSQSSISCLEISECNFDLLPCNNCSYNITLKENTIINHMLYCCKESYESSTWARTLLNKSYLEVYTHFGDSCNKSNIVFNLPLLDTYSFAGKNNNIIRIEINVKPNNLRTIDLSSNSIRIISRDIFNKYKNLQKLLLNKNFITNIVQDSFAGLTKLEYLDLSENNLSILTNVFTPLKNLQHLNLSRNNIEFIHENYFNNWLLQHLDVSHNKLRKLAPGALQLLPNLARLLLTDNPHLGITQLDTQLLVGTGRRLQQVDASRTGLYQVPEAFTHSVRFLSLIGNKITAIRCGDLDSYPLLQSLDFSDNKIISVEDDSLGRLEMLLFLNINNNLLMEAPKSLPDELKYLSISNNLIKRISIPDFKNLPNLRILLLQHNHILFIQDHVFDDLLSLEILDLSYNPIQTLSSNTFDGPLSLRDLRLCFLNISMSEEVGSFPMSSPESVQMLHLQSSPGLARQFLADSAALAAFSRLQYLDLRSNNLTEIRNDLLFYLVQLKTLRLHGNNINCTKELWLRDWMNWNKSFSDGETCYFSTLEDKTEVTKYNCTFQETFTINESLPPVNLYSTEMINKLLRYYGYLNNKIDRSYINPSQTEAKSKNNNGNFTKNVVLENYFLHTDFSRKKNKSLLMKNSRASTNENVNETLIKKVKDLIENNDENEQLNLNNKFMDISQFIDVPDQRSAFVYHDDIQNQNISGKRLNTPVAAKHPVLSIYTTAEQNEKAIISDTYTQNPNEKLEYSPYQLRHQDYVQYIGIAAVLSLIVISLILWASFRLKFRRQVLVTDTENQIEVSNISGGVLW